ncbi:MAG TPA: hypothetical protein ENF21_09310 [Bacteroidetes bacterium]|nr:hypothetical protein [Bacteroidota bacterium]
MKRYLLLSLLAVFTLTQLSAQDPIFVKGDKVLNFSLGLGSTLYTGGFYTGQIPPVSGSLEIGLLDELIEDKGSVGVGPYLGFSSYKWEYMDWGWKYTNIILGARGNFHYPFIDKLDTYTGILLGFRIVSASEFGTPIPGYNYSASSSGLAGSWFIGARYYFTENLAAMGELGYGIAWLNIGVALKF